MPSLMPGEVRRGKKHDGRASAAKRLAGENRRDDRARRSAGRERKSRGERARAPSGPIRDATGLTPKRPQPGSQPLPSPSSTGPRVGTRRSQRRAAEGAGSPLGGQKKRSADPFGGSRPRGGRRGKNLPPPRHSKPLRRSTCRGKPARGARHPPPPATRNPPPAQPRAIAERSGGGWSGQAWQTR